MPTEVAEVVPEVDYVWEQGSDLELAIQYQNTDDAGVTTNQNLTGYSLRMDITDGTTRLYTFNSADITDISPTDSTHEVVLGTDGSINITVPRSLTLTGGAILTAMNSGKVVFFYDVFLRNTVNKQKKILKGSITVNRSHTLWT